MQSFLYRVVLFGLVIIIHIGLIALDTGPLVVALFLALTTLVAGSWMAYLHSRFLMAVTPVVVAVLMVVVAIKVFEPRIFAPATEKVWFPLSLLFSIPFYIYLSYLLEVEEKRRVFRTNVIDFFRGVTEEIQRDIEIDELLRDEPPSVNELRERQQQNTEKEPVIVSSSAPAPKVQKEEPIEVQPGKRKIILD